MALPYKKMCDNCRHYAPYIKHGATTLDAVETGKGECRRFPPLAHGRRNVDPFYSCGEHAFLGPSESRGYGHMFLWPATQKAQAPKAEPDTFTQHVGSNLKKNLGPGSNRPEGIKLQERTASEIHDDLLRQREVELVSSIQRHIEKAEKQQNIANESRKLCDEHIEEISKLQKELTEIRTVIQASKS